MRTQTPQKREQFACALRTTILGVFAVFVSAFLLLQVWPARAVAAANTTINFQARLETSAGAIAPDGYYNVEFKLYDATTSGTSSQGSCTGDSDCLWTETRTGGNRVKVVDGYLTVNLGSVTAFPGSINWDQELWLTMNIGGTDATTPNWDGEMNPRLKLTAVPYAFQAKSAEQFQTKQGSNTGTLSFGTLTDNRSITLPDENGTVCLENSTNCGFLTSGSISGSFVSLQSSTPGTADHGNFNIDGTGLMGALGVTNNATIGGTLTVQGTGAFTGTVSGADAVNSNDFVTKGQLDTAIGGVGGGVTSLNLLAGALTLQGTTGQINVTDNGTDTVTLALDSSVTLQGNSFNAANELVQLDANGYLPALNGSALTSLNASNLTTGTVNSTLVTGSYTGITSVGTLDSLAVTGGITVGGTGAFTGTVSGADAVNNNDFATLGQLNTAVGGVATGVNTIGTIDAGTYSDNGASISADGTTLYLQAAGQTHTGLITYGDQTFGGNKTFAGNVLVQNNSATALQVLGTGGTVAFTVDNSQNKVAVGDISGGITGQLQVLPANSNRIGLHIQSKDNTQTGNMVDLQGYAGQSGSYIAAYNENGSTTSPNIFQVQYNGVVNIGGGQLRTFNQTAASTNSQAFSINSGDVTGTGSNSGSVNIRSGNAASGSAGGVTIDSGTGTAGTGSVSIGTVNASGVNIGRSGTTVTVVGTLSVTGAGSFTGTVSGADAVNDNDFVTKGQLNTAVGGVAPTLQDVYNNSNPAQIQLNATNLGLIVKDASTSVGGNLFAIQDATGATSYLAVTTTGASVAGDFTVSGGGSFTGTVSGADAVNANDFATLGQLNTAVGGVATGVTTIGTIDTGTYSDNGASISGDTLFLQAATGSHTGLVTYAAQTFGGDKTFTGVVYGTTLQGSTSLLSPVLDTITSGGTLSVGATNATNINIGGSATVNQHITLGSSVMANGTIVLQTGYGGDLTGGIKMTVGSNTTFLMDTQGRATFTSLAGENDMTFTVNGNAADNRGLILGVNPYTSETTVRGQLTVLQAQTGGGGSITANSLSLDAGINSGSGLLNYTTPMGATIQTTLAVPLYSPAAYGQIIALGLPSTAPSTSRAITLLDARTSAHQPTIAVLSPNESQIFGLTWDGSDTTSYLKTTGTQLGFGLNGGVGMILDGSTAGLNTLLIGSGAGTNGALQLENSTNANSVALTTGAVTASYNLQLPTAIGTAGQCLSVTGVTGTTASLGYAACSAGTGNFVSLQGSTPGTADHGNFNIDGTGIAGALQAPSLDTSGTLNIGATNATGITIGRNGMITTFGGSINGNNGISLNGTYSTINNNRLYVGGTLQSTSTGYQYGMQNSVSFNPQGASINGIFGFTNNAIVSGSSLNIPNLWGGAIGISTTSGYTGQVAAGIGLQITSPSIGGSQPILQYIGLNVNSNSTNGGNTSGAISNYQISTSAVTAGAGTGGTVNNYALNLTQPAGTGGTTNNYGLYIQGNGSGTSGANYSIYNASTAASYFAGRIGIGTTSPGYLLDVSGGTGIVAQFSGRVIGANAVNNNEFTTLGQVNTLVAAAGAGSSYVSLQGSTPGTADHGNFNIDGVGIAGSLQVAAAGNGLDTAASGALNVGGTNATAINLNQDTNIAAGKSLMIGTGSATALQVKTATSQLLTADASNNQLTVGAVGGCNSVVTVSELCVNGSSSAGGTAYAVQGTSLSIASASTMSSFANIIGIQDTSSNIANIDYGIHFDAGGTTNTSAIVNAFFAQVTAGQPGDFLQFQSGASTVLSVSNAGELNISTNSTAAFIVQNTLGAAVMTVDTANARVIIGGTTDGVIINSNGISLKGAARQAKTILLTAEYAGAVLDPGTGSNNTGTMVSRYDMTNRMNYYKWTTSQSTNQSYDIAVQVPIPSDFDSWNGGVAITDYTSDITNGTIQVQAIDSNGAVESGCNFVDITPASTNTWSTGSACQLTSGTYTPGLYMTLRIRVQSPNGGDVRVGNIDLYYKNKF